MYRLVVNIPCRNQCTIFIILTAAVFDDDENLRIQEKVQPKDVYKDILIYPQMCDAYP